MRSSVRLMSMPPPGHRMHPEQLGIYGPPASSMAPGAEPLDPEALSRLQEQARKRQEEHETAQREAHVERERQTERERQAERMLPALWRSFIDAPASAPSKLLFGRPVSSRETVNGPKRAGPWVRRQERSHPEGQHVGYVALDMSQYGQRRIWPGYEIFETKAWVTPAHATLHTTYSADSSMAQRPEEVRSTPLDLWIRPSGIFLIVIGNRITSTTTPLDEAHILYEIAPTVADLLKVQFSLNQSATLEPRFSVQALATFFAENTLDDATR